MKIGYAIYPSYCGSKVNRYGQIVDIYMWFVRYIEITDEELKKLKDAARKSKDIQVEIEKFLDDFDAHVNLCSARDCGVARARWSLEFVLELLRKLGIEKEPVALRCVDEAPQDLVYPVEFLSSILPDP